MKLTIDNRFPTHGCDTETRQYCSWSGRVAVDFKNKRFPAREAHKALKASEKK
jgi:hypothetical protein